MKVELLSFNLKKNKMYLSMFLILLVGLFIKVSGKTIEDPVARHDAKQCGTYLCSRLPDLATSYIQSGCTGKFTDYISELVKPEELNLELIESVPVKKIINNDVDFNTLFYMIILSFIISMALGYWLRNTEKTSYRYWMVQQKEF